MPEFSAQTTKGELPSFHDFCRGKWTMLFRRAGAGPRPSWQWAEPGGRRAGIARMAWGQPGGQQSAAPCSKRQRGIRRASSAAILLDPVTARLPRPHFLLLCSHPSDFTPVGASPRALPASRSLLSQREAQLVQSTYCRSQVWCPTTCQHHRLPEGGVAAPRDAAPGAAAPGK